MENRNHLIMEAPHTLCVELLLEKLKTADWLNGVHRSFQGQMDIDFINYLDRHINHLLLLRSGEVVYGRKELNERRGARWSVSGAFLERFVSSYRRNGWTFLPREYLV